MASANLQAASAQLNPNINQIANTNDFNRMSSFDRRTVPVQPNLNNNKSAKSHNTNDFDLMASANRQAASLQLNNNKSAKSHTTNDFNLMASANRQAASSQLNLNSNKSAKNNNDNRNLFKN